MGGRDTCSQVRCSSMSSASCTCECNHRERDRTGTCACARARHAKGHQLVQSASRRAPKGTRGQEQAYDSGSDVRARAHAAGTWWPMRCSRKKRTQSWSLVCPHRKPSAHPACSNPIGISMRHVMTMCWAAASLQWCCRSRSRTFLAAPLLPGASPSASAVSHGVSKQVHWTDDCARENVPPQMCARGRKSPNRFLADLDVRCNSDQEGWSRVKAVKGGGPRGRGRGGCIKSNALRRPWPWRARSQTGPWGRPAPDTP